MTTQIETPLTDAEWAKGGHLGGYRFAKNLERSLTSANQRIAFLESAEIGQIEQENKALKQQLAEKEANNEKYVNRMERQV